MKKLSTALEVIGFLIFAVAVCAQSESMLYQILIGIVATMGLLIICAGIYIERSWSFEEKEDFLCVDRGGDDTDDGITYIEYDSSGAERYMDFR